MKPNLITTGVNGATYTHLPERDLFKDLAKAQRKWRGKPKTFQPPVLGNPAGNGGFETVLSRTLEHFETRLKAIGDDPAHLLVITLFRPAKPQTDKFNQEVKLWALRDPRICINYVDPVDWGLA